MSDMENIKVIRGNIFNTKCQTIVNTVNCVGVMGKGIALVFRLRYPEMLPLYQEHCKNRLITIGKLWLYKAKNPNQPWVLNFPTKIHWKFPSEYAYIEEGLQKFVETYKERNITSIAFPMLGTSNGGLDKEIVLEIMLKYLSVCDIPIEIYDYDPNAADDLFETFKRKWNSIMPGDRRKLTGIRTQQQIDILNAEINNPQNKSMIQLMNVEGIGIKTMESCFNVVMNYVGMQKLL